MSSNKLLGSPYGHPLLQQQILIHDDVIYYHWMLWCLVNQQANENKQSTVNELMHAHFVLQYFWCTAVGRICFIIFLIHFCLSCIGQGAGAHQGSSQWAGHHELEKDSWSIRRFLRAVCSSTATAATRARARSRASLVQMWAVQGDGAWRREKMLQKS